jgi:signal transduction histidine kinase
MKQEHRAQKTDAVGQLTGGIAHDFNNILQVIIGNLEIIRIAQKRAAAGGQDPGPAIERATATAERAAQSARQLVQRLLAFGRRQPLTPAVLDPNTFVLDMMEMIERALGAAIRVETTLASDAWPVLADRNQLEEALLDLVINARDAMAHGGRLRIETGNADLRAGALDELAPGRYVALRVRDTGTGIAPGHLARVFEPFFTTKDFGKGAGLGLSIVKAFMKQSGGHISVDSEVGAGTIVTLYLPCAVEDSTSRA